MSEKKKTTTLYLRRDALTRCKELGINISETVNHILAVVLERPGIHDEEIMLAILQSEKQTRIRRIEELQNDTKTLQMQVDMLEQKIEKQKSIVNEIHRSDTIAQLIRQLNQRIKDAEFDESVVRAQSQDVLTELRKLNVPVDKPEWLSKQIERMKRLQV